MNDNISDDRVFLRGATDQLCIALLNGTARYVDNPLQRHARAEIAKLLEDAIAAGRLIDAGPISTQQFVGPVAVAAMKETKAGLFQLPHLATPIVFSVETRSGGDEWPATLVIVEGLGREMRLTSLMAVFGPNGEVSLTPTRDLAEAAASSVARHTPGRQSSPEQRKTSEDVLNQAAIVLLYLSACKAAITSAAHNGIAYSKLDVEKAIRLKAAEKAQAEPTAPSDGPRFLTPNEARRALTNGSPVDHGRGDRQALLLSAALEAKAGRLFVIENLPLGLVKARREDADAAVEGGALRPPFEPHSFILATVERGSGAYLLVASTSGVGGRVEFYGFRPRMIGDGLVVWGEPPEETEANADAGAADFLDTLQAYVLVCLSLIADSRSPVTRVVADDKLNKARIKRGKAPIPPYFRIEAGPTVLVPGAPPKTTTARGGTHASPRPHDRRGHPRHLKSGRTVWVKDCRINALIPHLTRGREFYEIKVDLARPKIVPPSLDGEDAKR